MATPQTPNLESINKPADAAQEGADPQTQAEVEQPVKRILVGLGPCRFMMYVMANLALRPFLVVDAGDGTGEAIDGILFFNGRADSRNHPVPLRNDDSGHLPAHSVNLQGVRYDPSAEEPGTVHWPARQPVMAASVDPATLSPTLLAILEPIVERIQKNLTDAVNEKLDANVDTVNKLLDSHSRAMAEILSDAKQPVLGSGSSANRTATGADLEARDARQSATLAEGVGPASGSQDTENAGKAAADPATQAQSAETPQTGS